MLLTFFLGFVNTFVLAIAAVRGSFTLYVSRPTSYIKVHSYLGRIKFMFLLNDKVGAGPLFSKNRIIKFFVSVFVERPEPIRTKILSSSIFFLKRKSRPVLIIRKNVRKLIDITFPPSIFNRQ
jgi:hypothetical protein